MYKSGTLRCKYVYINLDFVDKKESPKACGKPAEGKGTKPVDVKEVKSGETYTYECDGDKVPDGDGTKMTISCNDGTLIGTSPSCVGKV